MNITKTLVAYHANCIDGFTSAWITHKELTARGEEVDLIPMEYNDISYKNLLDTLAAADTYYDKLFVVDFSLHPEEVSRLKKLDPDLDITILDHHKTAFEMYIPELGLCECSVVKHGATIILDNSKSGAGICWDYFNNNIEPPTLIKYVQDRDLWKFEFGEETRHVHQYLLDSPKTLKLWDKIAKDMESVRGRNNILETGCELYLKYKSRVTLVARDATPIFIDDYMIPGVQCKNPELISDVGHILATKSGTFGVCYTIKQGESTIKWSLRSVDDFDVSAIAKKYGGGGHKNAAGFETKLLGVPPIPEANRGSTDNE